MTYSRTVISYTDIYRVCSPEFTHRNLPFLRISICCNFLTEILLPIVKIALKSAKRTLSDRPIKHSMRQRGEKMSRISRPSLSKNVLRHVASMGRLILGFTVVYAEEKFLQVVYDIETLYGRCLPCSLPLLEPLERGISDILHAGRPKNGHVRGSTKCLISPNVAKNSFRLPLSCCRLFAQTRSLVYLSLPTN